MEGPVAPKSIATRDTSAAPFGHAGRVGWGGVRAKPGPADPTRHRLRAVADLRGRQREADVSHFSLVRKLSSLEVDRARSVVAPLDGKR
jgi:hypothetical protein